MVRGKILNDILKECKKIASKNINYDEKILQLSQCNTNNMLVWDDDIANKVKENNLHWGQLKLFLSEIIHLVNFINEYDIIIYAGAAPGIHIVLLADLLSTKKFFLFDPNNIWDARLYDKKNVVMCTKSFNDIEAHRLFKFNKRYFLISDIRNLDIGYAKIHDLKKEQDNIVENDMHIQFGFWHQLQPCFALFKFRLMLGPGISTFPAGDIYLPIYGKYATSESRLLIKKYNEFNTAKYNNEYYRQRMFYYNINERNDAVLAAIIICRASQILSITHQFLLKKIKSEFRYIK
jgi:hypothetical protein